MCNCDFEKLSLKFSEAEKLRDSGSSDEAFSLYSQFITEALRCMSDRTTDRQKTELNKKLGLAFNNRGFIHYNRVNFDEAVADYTEALKLDNKLFMTYYNRGLIHYRLGRYEQAIDDMIRALTLQPDFTPAQCCLSQAKADKLEKDLKS